MIRDRGSIKWTAMMLPEHKKMLCRLYEELNHKEKPCLDEQQYEQFNQMMQKAMDTGEMLGITYYVKGDFKRIRGVIRDIDLYKGEVKVLDACMQTYYLLLKDIIDIKVEDRELWRKNMCETFQ